MKRVAIYGGEDLRAAASALGLEEDELRAEAALVDADDEAGVRRALALPTSLPRVFLADGPRAALLRTAGVAHVMDRPVTPSALGPLMFALERGRVRRPAVVICCAASGATGRTSLVANLALRVARGTSTVALDATGTGALAWRLGATVAAWPEIAAVGADLGEGHLRLAAVDRDGVLVVGGLGVPEEDLVRRVVELAGGIGVVFVDAPAYRPPTSLVERADRVIVCANPDAASAAATRGLLDWLGDQGAQLVVSQVEERDAPELASLYGRPATFLLPKDDAACRRALASRGPAGGRLGRAYDAIAEILLAEIVP